MDKTINFSNLYERILKGPSNPEEEFILSGYTYKEVYELAAGIKDRLSSPGDRNEAVCLCTDNKAVIIAALLASLAGGPTIVMPYSFSERVILEIRDTEGLCKAITNRPDDLPDGIEGITPEQCRKSDLSALTSLRDPDSVFLKLFTGGSTGKPRIWSKTPRNLLSEALYLSQKFQISKNDLFASTVPSQHIYGLLFSIVIPFISSARITGNVCTFPQEIISSIENHATILVGVPMHYRILKESVFQGHSLRTAFSSGGMLDEADAAYFHSQTGIGIVEVYGSTETGGIATRCRADGDESWKSFDNIEWKIVKERLHVNSEFVSAELYRDDNGFYITGDRALLYNDNSFILMGRADGVVKVAGKRVDLGEVEAKLKQIPSVNDAVVISIPAQNGRMNEIAALVSCDVDEVNLRQSAAEMFEPYAIPRRIRIVDRIPVSATGKYDRKSIEQLLQSDDE